MTIADKTAIAGIGWTALSRASGRSVLDLACEACLAATRDAGIEPRDVDGLMTSYWGPGGLDTVDPRAVAVALDITDCRYQLLGAGGGTALCAMIGTAAMAVYSGTCECVLVYRAANAASERRVSGGIDAWQLLYGQVNAAAIFGPVVTAYMAKYGVEAAEFAPVAVSQRSHAHLNTKALKRDPISVEDHQQSPWIVEPFRLLDCCIPADGGVALLVTSVERARSLRQAPVIIQGFVGGIATWDRQPLWEINAPKAAHVLYTQAGITADDIDFAQLYDPFTGICLVHMEGFGLADRGLGAQWVAGGGSGLDGDTPVNTHGGLLSEGHLGGYGHVLEAVQQLRPGGVVDDLCPGEHDFVRSTCRQLRDASLGLVCGELGESALLLRKA